MLELAVNIANIQNAKNPKRAVKSADRQLRKSEHMIIHRSDEPSHRINLTALSKINKMFGGET